MPLGDLQERSLIEALDGPQVINAWEGAVRSGKTMSSILAWCEYVRVLAPPGPLIMIGKTKDTLRRNVLDEIDSYFGDASPLKHTAGANEGRLFGRKVHMVGANDAKALSRIQGLTLAGSYVDEGTLLPGFSFWSMLLTRHATTIPAGAKIFVTMNPGSPAHWMKREVLDKGAAVRVRSWHFTLDDNPILTQESKDLLKASLAGLFYKRYIDGLWVAAEGAVYDMLDLDTGGAHRAHWANVRRQLVGRWWMGVDYGTSNPTHAVLLGLGADERLYVCGEWRHDGRANRSLSDAEQSERLRAWLDAGARIPLPAGSHPDSRPSAVWPERTAVDPSAASFRRQLRNDGWTGLVDADNPVLDGIRNTSSLLAARRLLFVDGAAPELEREMLGYVWDEKKQDKGLDEPAKVDDHGCLVAGTPVTTARGPVPIEDVHPGDVVLTRAGWRPVLVAGRTQQDAPVVTAHLDNGQTLTGTPDHPVWAGGRWTPLADTAYLSVSTCPILPPPVPWLAVAGPLLTAASRAVTRFTTVTATRSTTSSTTSSSSPSPHTRRSTARKAASVAAHTLRLLWPVSAPPSGTDPTRAVLGMPSTGGPRGTAGRPTSEPATSAAPGTTPALVTGGSGSARTPASPPPAGHLAWTTWTGPASSVGADSGSTAMRGPGSAGARVLAVTATGSADVYNLRVAGCHEFYAAGVLVSNCDALRYSVQVTRSTWRPWLQQPYEQAA